MTATVPFLKPYVDAIEAGEPLPPYARRELAFGTAEDVAGLVAFLASEAAADVTGQAIGIGGDRLSLCSHPAEIAHELRDGGWTADAIADAVGAFAAQPYGVRLPPLSLS
jgi:NAD(P)-dependent dehydrogenase (short-subunit alcohol dehydrogenase family)